MQRWPTVGHVEVLGRGPFSMPFRSLEEVFSRGKCVRVSLSELVGTVELTTNSFVFKESSLLSVSLLFVH